MKGKPVFKIFMVITLFFLSSCREYFITTKINSDGTVERTVLFKEDNNSGSREMRESQINKPGWDIVTSLDSSNSKITITGKRIYSSFDEVNGETTNPYNFSKPIIDVKIEKHFRFFFTYYTYKESYMPYEIYTKIPINKFFTPEELSKIKENIDSSWIKQKLDIYDNVILFDRYFDVMEESLFNNDGIAISKLISKDKKLELFIELAKSNKKDDEINGILKKYFDEKIAYKIIQFFNSSEKTDRNEKLKQIDDIYSDYNGSFTNNVIMPGIITSSNSKAIEGNKVNWTFDQDRFKFFSYEMTAESREVNTWVIIISGLVVLLLAIGLLLPKLRKKALI